MATVWQKIFYNKVNKQLSIEADMRMLSVVTASSTAPPPPPQAEAAGVGEAEDTPAGGPVEWARRPEGWRSCGDLGAEMVGWDFNPVSPRADLIFINS
jgi:hypothetical protein